MLADALSTDPKERAEHVMLVDLGRNDLQRVCEAGTVDVVEFMNVRRYSHVTHLESTVVGDIRPDRSPADLLAGRSDRDQEREGDGHGHRPHDQVGLRPGSDGGEARGSG